MNMLLPLTPAMSKRLIAKAIVQMPLVRSRLQHGKIAISNGSTTGYIIEELLGQKIDISHFPSGVITRGRICETGTDRIRTFFFQDGIEIPRSSTSNDYEDMAEFYADFGPDDLFIKGANAIDPAGNAGFFLGHSNGGNLMLMYSKIAARRVPFLIPVGLEKMISSVPIAGKHVYGNQSWNYRFGMSVGYLTVTDGILFTELDAIRILCGADACHIGSGGIGGGEGSVILSLQGTSSELDTLLALLPSIQREPNLTCWRKDCRKCCNPCDLFPTSGTR